MRDFEAHLEQRRRAYLYRQRYVVEGRSGAVVQIDGRKLINFCSNDYLGLASHPAVIAAFRQGAARYGVGSGAAHLITGHAQVHHALEEELAAFVGRPRALLFSTGYMANLGVISALVGMGDALFEDRFNHASLVDGGLLSRARFARYAHADADALRNKLATSRSTNRLVVTDGLFSMDGDIAPLAELAAVCHAHNAWLMVDDAHGLGVLGHGGRGSVAHYGLGGDDVPVLMGTLGKAFGVFGAFVAGSEALIETLIQQARSYIYTTALPPAIAAATRASLVQVCEEEWRRARLHQLIARFRSGAATLGLPLMDSATPIQPLLLGSARAAVIASEKLLQQGLLISAIRPPTVPEGSARLRITLTADHSDEQIDHLLEGLDRVKDSLHGSVFPVSDDAADPCFSDG